MKDFKTFQSPFSWRYGSEGMRHIWSEENKYTTWRKIWVEMARAQKDFGLVSQEELEDLEKNQNNIDIERIWEIEKETKHDVVAAIREFAEKATVGGGKIHAGATSMDIVDNTDTLRIKKSLEIVENNLKQLLKEFTIQIEKYADLPCMGFTHLQPAEPTTLGYRLSLYAQDLLEDLQLLNFVKTHLKAKGLKGAVGTQASYTRLVKQENVKNMEQKIMNKLGLEEVLIANQVGLRKADLFVAQLLTSIAQSLYKFAFDLRVMQSPGFGEWQEPFGKSQVGSSAMPFKKNPMKAEQICSLARLVESLSSNAWENASLSLLERTLDDSANRRVYIPEMFLAIDEMMTSAIKIVNGLLVHEQQIKNNLDKYGPFSATEAILMEAVKKGANRQTMHETLRDIAMIAWNDVQENKPNPMGELLKKNEIINQSLNENQIQDLLDVREHIGTAPERAKQLVSEIKKFL
ncbi:adenylosuccinate lyase [Candidatus Roizmanbacteria bacterium]|nr:adenylosuccinate lyase [Candidatus Roizmanbacteria bacterium]